MKALRTLFLLSMASGLCLQGGAQEGDPRPARAADPVAVVLEAFRTHALVGLSEGQHWNEQGHRFRLDLVRDPRFAEQVNDIVVEYGSSRYQGLMDRFVAGGDVPYESLRQAWENTTAPNTVWDMPIYEEFFGAVRSVNQSLPPKKRLRVLLGDPPIDWTKVSSKAQILEWMGKRDAFAADLVRKDVLDKHRRALLLYGDGHLFRSGPEPNLASLIEQATPGALFNIGAPTSFDLRTLQPDVAHWPAPTIAVLRGTALGAAPVGPYYEEGVSVWTVVPMSDQFDALLYLGPPETITLSAPAKAKCADAAYLKRRLGRMALVPWGQDEIDRLKGFCGNDRAAGLSSLK